MSRKGTSGAIGKIGKLAAAGLVACLWVGCAKVNTMAGAGGTTGTGGMRGTGAGNGTGNVSGGGGVVGDGGLINADLQVGVCQEGNYMYVPQIPTVYVMVDRSGSMFDCISTAGTVEPSCTTPADTAWVKLKEAVLMVVSTLQMDVRFGFASFTGTNVSNGGTCPVVDMVAPALNNSAAIATLYNSLVFPPNTTESGKKFETPARQALDMIGGRLIGDTMSPGEKFILFVTDGQPDYCDDSNSLCAPDSVIGGLQLLKTKGITTIVMGLKSAVNDLAPGILEAFANAGAGEPTLAPLKPNLDSFAFYDQCNSIAPWHADLVTAAKPPERGSTVGTYATVAGPTKPFAPDASNQAMLVNQLSLALSGVKSCLFDLNNLDGKMLMVNQTMLDQVSVKVMGTAVPLDSTNGWRMNSASELELVGTACSNWRMPQNMNIDIQIPCAVIVIP